MKRLAFCLGGLVLIAALARLVPLFHIILLSQAKQEGQARTFDAAVFARQFWDQQLLPAVDRACSLPDLLAALSRDQATARTTLGRKLGLSSTTYFFVKGSGRISSVTGGRFRIEVDGSGTVPKVEVSTDPVFGNAVRDATGLIDVSKFPNSQDFNDLSTALNHIVETQIVPGLREHAVVGKAVRFVGCLELDEGDTPEVLEIIPVKVEWL